MENKDIIFISGTDTDAGKSYATGWLAAQLRRKGRVVMTQKLVQTGNVGRSEDIELHRMILGDSFAYEPWADTAPVIFSYPASPHLAARLDGKEIDIDAIDQARYRLVKQCDTLLIEGAGGLLVPLTEELLTADYVASRGLDIALVANGKLGSINHALLSLEAIASRGLNLRYLLYNTYFDSDEVIAAETQAYLRRYVAKHFPAAEFLTVPTIEVSRLFHLN